MILVMLMSHIIVVFQCLANFLLLRKGDSALDLLMMQEVLLLSRGSDIEYVAQNVAGLLDQSGNCWTRGLHLPVAS